MNRRKGTLLGAIALIGLVCGATMAQSITLDPTSGPPGTEVTAAGTGFATTSCGVALYLDATDGTMLADAMLDDGSFSTTLVVPNDTTVGEHTIIAVGMELDGDNCTMATDEQASATFMVEQPGPSVTLDPASGPPYSIFFVQGELFDVDACGVDLYLDSAAGTLLGSAQVEDGAFLREIQIPMDTTVGDHPIVAVALAFENESCATLTGEEASASYEVVEADPGPFVSDPVMPIVQDIDLSNLPAVAPWTAGEPVLLAPGASPDGEMNTGVPVVKATVDVVPDMTGTWMAQSDHRERGSYAGRRFARTPEDTRMRQTLSAMTLEKGAPRVNVFGIPSTGIIPPDVGGDVGPDHFIQTVNAAFAVFDKQGNLLAGPVGFDALWADTGGDCETGNDGNPDVRYDALADRWIISSVAAGSSQCLAISRNDDPVSGGWYLYAFPTGGVTNHYARLAVWPDAYYVGTQRGYPTAGSDAWAFDRAAMLDGEAAIAIRFYNPATFMLPADLDGEMPPAEGTPATFVRQVDGAQLGGDDRIEMAEFAADFDTPANSTFTTAPDLTPDAFDRNLCGYGLYTPCIPQPDAAPVLASFTALPLARLQYRNFGDFESLVFNHTVDADGNDHAGIRWYELRRAGAGWTIEQQGTYAPDGGDPGLDDDVQRWMGSAAMDKNQNFALAYSVASASEYPGLRYGGRYADDPPNTLPRDETTLVAGGGAQTHESGLWGGLSSMTVDPVDGCTFWFTSEYYAETSEAGWSTRIGSFQLDNVPPSITCPEAAVAECSETGGTPADNEELDDFFAGASATDDCSLETTIDDDAPDFFDLGTTDVTFTAYDTETNQASCESAVEIQDTIAPDITAPADLEDVECTSPEGASPELGDPSVDDICDASPVIGNDAPPVFPIGTTTVTWTATDQSDNVGSDTQDVEVVDTTPPMLEVEATPSVIWPPNHKMIDIHVTVRTSDICDLVPEIRLVSITSDEAPNGNGDGNTKPDFDRADFGTDDRYFRVRAERKGNGDGRTYTIEYVAEDDSGNTTTAYTTVFVPHDQGN
jgi:hypothetical protein